MANSSDTANKIAPYAKLMQDARENRQPPLPNNHAWWSSLLMLVFAVGWVIFTFLYFQAVKELTDMRANETAQATSWAQVLSALDVERRTATSLAATATQTKYEAQAVTQTAAASEVQTKSCQQVENYKVQLEAGPDLTPAPQATYVFGSPRITPRAVWRIFNASQCIWRTLTVRLQKPGETVNVPIDLETQPSLPIEPGAPATLIVSFFELEDVVGDVHYELILVINDLELPDPILTLQVTPWLVVVSEPSIPATSTAIPTYQPVVNTPTIVNPSAEITNDPPADPAEPTPTETLTPSG